MKTCLLINSLAPGGAERVVSNLLLNGSDVDYLLQIWPDKFYDTGDLKPHFLLHKKILLPFDLIIAIFKLFFFVKKNNITHINSHLFWSNYINTIVSFFTGHKVICTHCVSLESKFQKSGIYYLHKFLIKMLFNDGVIHTFKSKELELEYVSKFMFVNTQTIYNPIDKSEVINKSKLKPEIELNLDPNKFYFLCVGRFHKTKKQIEIIKSLQYVNENIVVVFIGNGSELDKCKSLSRKLLLENRVVFLGNINNPYPYYAKIDFYISASSSEGFPNSLIEAVFLNCFPLQTLCKTGPKEIISSFGSDNGYIINDENAVNDYYREYCLGILIPVNNQEYLRCALNYVYKSKPILSDSKVDSLTQKLCLRRIVGQYNSLFK